MYHAVGLGASEVPFSINKVLLVHGMHGMRASQGHEMDCSKSILCALATGSDSEESATQGLPLSLSGVRRIMDNMDWGGAFEFVSFGHVNPDQLDDSDFYILVAPQNVVGSPIIHNLIKMVSHGSNSSYRMRCVKGYEIRRRHLVMAH